MKNSLQPNQSVQSVYEINLSSLYAQGFRNIIIDLDNTITPWRKDIITPQLEEWVRNTHDLGFKVCLLSNSPPKRVQPFARRLGVLAAPKGGKPISRAFHRALRELDARPKESIMIGDQIFTDIWGGNRVGLYTILVEPMTRVEFFGTKINRMLERILAGRR